MQRQRVDTDAEISDDTGQDQRHSVKFLGKLRKHKRSAKSHDLCSQKENDLSDGGKPQIRTDIDAVVDNGAYAVDIEEEGDQEEKHLLVVGSDLSERPVDLSKYSRYLSPLRFNVVDLLVFFQKR